MTSLLCPVKNLISFKQISVPSLSLPHKRTSAPPPPPGCRPPSMHGCCMPEVEFEFNWKPLLIFVPCSGWPKKPSPITISAWLGLRLPEWKSAVASNETQVMNSNSTSAVLKTPWMQTSPGGRHPRCRPSLDADPLPGQKEWQTLVKILPCTKLRLRTVITLHANDN